MVALDIPDTTADPGRLEQTARDLNTFATRLANQRDATVRAIDTAAGEFSEPYAGRIRGHGQQHQASAAPVIAGAQQAAGVTSSWASVVTEYKRRRAALINQAGALTFNSSGGDDAKVHREWMDHQKKVRDLEAKARALREWFEREAESHGARLAAACNDATTLRVFNLNIGQGAGNKPFDGKGTESRELWKIAQLVADGHADIATLQEIFGGDVKKLEQMLEKITGDDWTIYFGPASNKAQFNDWPSLFDERNPFVRYGPFGNAIAVRNGDILSSEPLGNHQLAGPSADEGRSLVGVRVHTNSGPMDIYTTHVAEDQYPDQANQINKIWGQVGADPRTVVTGDFNEALDGPAQGDPSHEALRRHDDLGYRDSGNAGATSVNGTGRRIDYIFTGKDLRAGQPSPVDGRPSDHNGMVVDVHVPEQGP